MTNPTQADIQTLTAGATYKINGRKYVVDGLLPTTGGVHLTGMRGGWANLVPSTCGKRVQVTTLNSRDWVRTIEAA